MPAVTGSDPVRVYRYCPQPRALGCVSILFALTGCGAFVVIPSGLDRIANGEKGTGYAIVALGAMTAVFLLIGMIGTGMHLRARFRRDTLSLTPDSIILPEMLRGRREMDDAGEPLGNWQPPEVPFSAIRWARREHGQRKGDAVLVIIHSLSPTTVVVPSWNMRRVDFDEFEAILRASIPAAFETASPSTT